MCHIIRRLIVSIVLITIASLGPALAQNVNEKVFSGDGFWVMTGFGRADVDGTVFPGMRLSLNTSGIWTAQLSGQIYGDLITIFEPSRGHQKLLGLSIGRRLSPENISGGLLIGPSISSGYTRDIGDGPFFVPPICLQVECDLPDSSGPSEKRKIGSVGLLMTGQLFAYDGPVGFGVEAFMNLTQETRSFGFSASLSLGRH